MTDRGGRTLFPPAMNRKLLIDHESYRVEKTAAQPTAGQQLFSAGQSKVTLTNSHDLAAIHGSGATHGIGLPWIEP